MIVYLNICLVLLYAFVSIVWVLSKNNKIKFNNDLLIKKILMVLNYLTIIVIIISWSSSSVQGSMMPFYLSILIIWIIGFKESKKQQKGIAIHTISLLIIHTLLGVIIAITGH